MKKMVLGALLAITFLILTGFARAEQETSQKALQANGVAPLTQSELETLMSRSRTARFAGKNNVTGTVTYAQEGTAKVGWNGGSDVGSWRINGDKFCTKYKKIRNGFETCFTFYKTGENEYQLFFFPEGNWNATFVYTN